MRARAGMTLDEAAKALYRTKSTLHRLEKGETILGVHLAKSVMDLYDQYDPDLIDQALRAREPGWWTTYGIENQGYIDVETEAAHVSELALLVIPGLLRTVGYMRALFEAHRLPRRKRWLENDIRVRQERLTGPDPLRLHAIIDEAALRKDVDGCGRTSPSACWPTAGARTPAWSAASPCSGSRTTSPLSPSSSTWPVPRTSRMNEGSGRLKSCSSTLLPKR